MKNKPPMKYHLNLRQMMCLKVAQGEVNQRKLDAGRLKREAKQPHRYRFYSHFRVVKIRQKLMAKVV